MLYKFLKIHKLATFSRSDHPNPPTPAIPERPEATSSVLKIVHAGGKVEYYYMAIPAIRILEKHPSCVIAKPEVFRRPWDSVVRPEKILTPGQKFFLVPRHTVKKLQRRIRKPNKELPFSLVSQAANDNASVDMMSSQNDVSSSSFFPQSNSGVLSEVSGSFSSAFRKKSGVKKHVRFVGIDVKHKASSSASGNKGKAEDNSGKRGARNGVAWHPSLTAISESQGN